MKKVRKGFDDKIFKTEMFSNVSDKAKALIKRLLTLKPEDRPTAAEALQDEWFDTTTIRRIIGQDET